MNTIRFFHLFLSVLFLLSSNVTKNYAQQCINFDVLNSESICDNNGTISDDTDDTFSATIYINNPFGTWSSSDGAYTNISTDGILYPFGPYPISGGNVTITITDDSGTCEPMTVTLMAPMPCSTPPIDCPEFGLCLTKVSEKGCCATYMAQFTGNLSQFVNINFNQIAFEPFTKISNLRLLQENGAWHQSGITITGNQIQAGSALSGNDLLNPSEGFIFDICGDDGEVLQPVVLFPGLFINGMPCSSTNTICPPVPSFTATGFRVGGNVYAPGGSSCIDTQNNGIEGASISITAESGENCSTTSSIDGSFGCNICDDGPYEVCVTTECPEPCGVNSLDLLHLLDYMLGKIKGNWYHKIVGDFNGDGRVTPADLLDIRKHILNLEYPKRKSYCEFLSVNDASNLNDIQNQDNCTTLNSAAEVAEFTRLMIGDIDFSCTDCTHSDDMGVTPVQYSYPSTDKLVISTPSENMTYGFSLVLDILKENSAFEVHSPLTNIEYAVVGNQLKIIWLDESYSGKGITIPKGGILAEIKSSQENALSSLKKGSYINNKQGISKLSNVDKRSVHDTKKVKLGNFKTIEVDARAKSIKILILDMTGKKISTGTYSIDGSYLDFRPVLKDGIYIIHIEDGFKTNSHRYHAKN